MNLLLDTHVTLWAAFTPEKLRESARTRLTDQSNQLWFSAVSLWEVAIKRGLNRPDFTIDPGPLRAGLLSNGYQELQLDGRHCLGLGTLPLLHNDPFDRMLIVQAAAEGMVLLTADEKVLQYSGPIEAV